MALIIASILLVGCGQKIHENIGEGLLEDTEQVIVIFDETIKDESIDRERREDLPGIYNVG